MIHRCTVLCLHEKFNKGFLPPSIFFAIIVFYLLNALLSNSDDVVSSYDCHVQKCNPFTSSSNYWVTAISVLLTVGSGYWMAYRIVNTETVEVKNEDAEKGEKKTMEIPDDGKHSFILTYDQIPLFGAFSISV